MKRTPDLHQKAVIDDFQNSILLYASAGTGKTFTVANKVGKIIRDGLASPEEILCLTFTIKACKEMAEAVSRVTDRTGVNIKTIHGFCLQIIEEEAKRSGASYVKPNVIDETDEEEILQSLIPKRLAEQKLSLFLREQNLAAGLEELFACDVVFVRPFGFFWRVLRNGEPVYVNSGCAVKTEREILKLQSRQTEEFVCPECGKRQFFGGNRCTFCDYDLRTYLKPKQFRTKNFRALVSGIKRYREIFGFYSQNPAEDYRRTFQRLRAGSDEKFRSLVSYQTDNGYETDEELIGYFSQCAGVVAEYDSLLSQSNKLDFDDLILGAKNLLKDASVLQRWRGKFRYIVIDEMQDTSVLEYSVLKQLFVQSRVMMCGDVFQTIYEWRGSVPYEVLEDFRKSFSVKVYMLSENYRSNRMLAGATFAYLRSACPEHVGRFCPEQIGIGSQTEGEPIRYMQCNSEREEAEFIYRYLLKHPPAKSSDVCIMSRSNGYIARLYQRLTAYGNSLPQERRLKFFTVDEDARFYKKSVVKDIIAFWSVLICKSDSIAMERIAARYLPRIGPATLSVLRGASGAGVSAASFLSEDSYLYQDCYDRLIRGFGQGNVIVYDTETTGLDLNHDEIIQISAIRIDADGTPTEQFNRYIFPQRDISEGAFRTHGISAETLKEKGAVTARQALIEFSDFVKGAVIVGHNSEQFDRVVLDRQLSEQGLPPLNVSGEYDTLGLSKLLCRECADHRLETLCRLFGFSNLRAHDAFYDVLATAQVLARLIQERLIPQTRTRRMLIGRYQKLFQPFYKRYTVMKNLLAANDLQGLNAYIADEMEVFSKYRELRDRAVVDELFEQVTEYAKGFKQAQDCLHDFIGAAALSGNQMDFFAERFHKIPVITVHQSKGCEFDTVLLAGVDSRNFPNYAAVQSGHEQEERRVFYVAVTRAKENLILSSYENGVSKNGDPYSRSPSPYLEYIPKECIRNYRYRDREGL